LIWEKRDSDLYHFSSLKLNYDEAEEYCNKHGGHLASIHNQQESEFIKMGVKNRYYMVHLTLLN